MSSWVNSDALTSLRSLLGDNNADKREFLSLCHPPANSITRRFFCGQPRLVTDSLTVFVGGAEASVSGVPDYTNGEFVLEEAPVSGVAVEASFNYAWFTDAELTQYLTQAALLLTFTGADDASMPTGLRPVVLDYAAYWAYMRKATEYADYISASAQGYTVDQSKPHPHWRELARMAYERAKDQLKTYVENPLGKKPPALAFVAYKLPRYVP